MTAAEDFLVFKKVMLSRNRELESQVWAATQPMDGSHGNAASDDEQELLETAMQESLRLHRQEQAVLDAREESEVRRNHGRVQ